MTKRFISPAKTLGSRFARKSDRPKWPIAVLCFRDPRGSQALLDSIRASVVGRKVLWGVEHSNDLPQVHEATINRHRVGIVSRCMWGGPQAAILVEELAELGVKHVIGYGAAGSISPDLVQGTQIVVSAALPTDGTSSHYTKRAVGPSRALSALLPNVRRVTAATVDAVYRETPKLISKWSACGIEAINMEVTPFYAAAARCHVDALWLGHISDVLIGNWKHWYVDRTGMNEGTVANCLAVIRGIG